MRLARRLVPIWLVAAALPACAAAAAADEHILLTLDSGREIRVDIRRPGTPGPYPAIMLFGGFKGAARVLDLLQTDAPLMRVSFDYPYDPPRKLIFPYSLQHLPAFKRALHETFEGIARLQAYLRTRSDVDAARITIVGASAGAPFAAIAAARHDLPGAIIVHGFGQLPTVAAQQFSRRWEPKYGRWVRGPARLLAALLACYLDLPSPEAEAVRLRAHQRVLVVDAADDTRIPQQSKDALWQALQQSPAQIERMKLAGGHLESEAAEQIAGILQHSLAWMRRQRLL